MENEEQLSFLVVLVIYNLTDELVFDVFWKDNRKYKTAELSILSTFKFPNQLWEVW